LFTKTIIRIFGSEYLCSLNEKDTIRLMAMNKKRGSAGHAWEYRLYALEVEELPKGMACLVLRYRDPTIVLEAVASHDLWI
jgi:hypothetical protein